MTRDYRATVFLPKTAFPMKADLPVREPEIQARWARIDLYRRLREAASGRPKFILHDGPPYANGHLHMGTALNKILKDVVNRSQQMLGKDAVYVPGWDCHGLPIEWQIEQRYRSAGKDKDAVPPVEFRRECREFAEHWIAVQRAEFERLGVVGDWQHPYTTMDYRAEAGIFRELAKFLLAGELYRGKKSVMWSVVEKTALAEAEVEYHDHTSTTITVRFPVARASHPALHGAAVLIWTTTPWTMPGNRALAYGADVDYLVIEVTEVAAGSLARPGEKLVLAASLAQSVADAAGITGWRTVAELKGVALAGTIARHPLHGRGYDFAVPLLAADFVDTEQGTGLVHIAPSHGADDFELGAAHGLEVPDTVAEDGVYTDEVPLFRGLHVFKAAEPVIGALVESDALLARGKLTHSYPHSWRSKAPLIFRATPQWFIPMDGPGRLRETALAAIEATRWVPRPGPQPHPRHDRDPPGLVHLAPARLGRADRGVRAEGERRGAARPRGGRADRPSVRAGDGTDAWFTQRPGASSSVRGAIRPTTSRSWTSSTSGSSPARPTRPCSSSGRTWSGRPRSTSRARTSTAAGSIPRCSRAAARAAARPTRAC